MAKKTVRRPTEDAATRHLDRWFVTQRVVKAFEVDRAEAKKVKRNGRS